MELAYPVGNFMLRLVLRAFAQWTVEGKGNVPPWGPLIVVANHQSNLDPPILGASLSRRIWFLAKDGIFRGRIVNWFLSSYGAFPLDRSGSDLRAYRWALNKLERDQVRLRATRLRESNPMLGHRGCRLGITYPEIYEMQCRAIFEAAANMQKKKIKVNPEIMVPLVGFKKELELQTEIVRRVAKEVSKEKGVKLKYLVGTMIEVPRGALTADEIAEVAEFFSFGTNDLTQMTMGMSRDDSGSFLPNYEEQEIVTNNPFAVIDQTGVGQLMEIAVTKGRSTRKNIKLGICGEHGGEPSSVKFCYGLGLNYVSCSPFRVPVARLAAAQAALA